MKEKGLELERLVFFCDAVVAIAITLLALDLKIDKPTDGHLHFKDIGDQWQKFAAFFLSFILIAVFWKIHHEFFYFIKKVDNPFLWYNIGWLFFIILLPFSTTLVSSHLFDTAAIFTYSANVLCITIFQNQIWDHVAIRAEYLNDKADQILIRNQRIACNVAMANGVIAVGLSFISPLAAFIILFVRLPMMLLAKRIFNPRRK